MQPFFTTEQFTGLDGKQVSLKDSLDGCERILRDEFKDIDESNLYMIGTIDEANAKADTKVKTKDNSKDNSASKPPSDAKDKYVA